MNKKDKQIKPNTGKSPTKSTPPTAGTRSAKSSTPTVKAAATKAVKSGKPGAALQTPIKSAPPVKAVKRGEAQADDIKFYYSGIKVDDGKLIECYYGLDNNKDHLPMVRIAAKERGARLPKKLNPENYTDIFTGYVDYDRAAITPESPYYKPARAAALVTEIMSLEFEIEYEAARGARRGEPLSAYFNGMKERLARYERELKELTAKKK
jgi:hypothetical protein